MSVNDIIVVTKQDGAWWEGSINGVTGVFPSNYVRLQQVWNVIVGFYYA